MRHLPNDRSWPERCPSSLTPADKALLPLARKTLADAGALQALAEGMAHGVETHVTLVVDTIFPMRELSGALHVFQQDFPSVTLNVEIASLGACADFLLSGKADCGLVAEVFSRHCHIYRIYCLLLASVAGPVLMKSTTQRFSVRPKNRLYLLNVTKPMMTMKKIDVGAIEAARRG